MALRGKQHPSRWQRVSQHTSNGELVTVYPSIQAAEFATNINHANIIRACKTRMKAGGFVWEVEPMWTSVKIAGHKANPNQENRPHTSEGASNGL